MAETSRPTFHPYSNAVSFNIITLPRCCNCVSDDGGGCLPTCAFLEEPILCRYPPRHDSHLQSTISQVIRSNLLQADSLFVRRTVSISCAGELGGYNPKPLVPCTCWPHYHCMYSTGRLLSQTTDELAISLKYWNPVCDVHGPLYIFHQTTIV